MQSQHRRFLWQIYLLLKQAPLASVGERAELELPGKRGLGGSGVPAGGATSLLSHRQGGNTAYVLRTSEELASSPLWKEMPAQRQARATVGPGFKHPRDEEPRMLRCSRAQTWASGREANMMAQGRRGRQGHLVGCQHL